MWDDSQQKVAGELEFKQPVKAVRLRKEKIVVVLEDKTFVFKMHDMTLIDCIKTLPNPRGMVALNSGETNMEVLATPAPETGHVRIDIFHKKKDHIIKAHDGPIAALSLCADGRLLATASDKGTLIRLYSSESGNNLCEFRRGSSKTEITSIMFDLHLKYVAVASTS